MVKLMTALQKADETTPGWVEDGLATLGLNAEANQSWGYGFFEERLPSDIEVVCSDSSNPRQFQR